MQSQSWLLTLAQRAQQVLDHRHTAALPITFQHHSSLCFARVKWHRCRRAGANCTAMHAPVPA